MLTEQLLGTIPKQQSELPDMVVKQVVDALDRQVDGTSTEKDKLLLAGASVKLLSPKQDIYNLGKLLEQGGRAIVSCSNSFNFWTSVRCSQLFKAYKIKPFEREVDHRGWIIEGSSQAERLVRELPCEKHLLFTSGQSLMGGSAAAALEAWSSLKGGTLDIVAGDSVYRFMSTLCGSSIETIEVELKNYKDSQEAAEDGATQRYILN